MSRSRSFNRFHRYLAPQRRLVVAAVICSLLNKLFDLAPPILIGLAVDVVLLKEQSVLAGFGLRTAGQQLWGLALLTFVIWAAESLFEYLYDCLLYTSPSPRDRTRSRMPSSA